MLLVLEWRPDWLEENKEEEAEKNLESYSTLLTIMAMMMMMVMMMMMMTASNSAPSLHAPSHRGIGWAGGVGREIFLKNREEKCLQVQRARNKLHMKKIQWKSG